MAVRKPLAWKQAFKCVVAAMSLDPFDCERREC